MSADHPTGPALLCWDGSASARRAIERAAPIMRDGHPARVLFVHVPTEASKGLLAGTSGPDAPIMGTTDAEILMQQGVGVAREAGFDASGLLVAADRRTAAIIVTTADEIDTPLIVMGQRGRSAIVSALLGSVARDVVNDHHRPVMLVGPAEPGPETAAPARPAA